MRPLPPVFLVDNTVDPELSRVEQHALENGCHVGVKDPAPIPLEVDPAILGADCRPIKCSLRAQFRV